jgi:hypothetical protein
MTGTLRWYWLDSDNGAYDAIDCKSEDSARTLSTALLNASVRPIRAFAYVTCTDDYTDEVVSTWYADDIRGLTCEQRDERRAGA